MVVMATDLNSNHPAAMFAAARRSAAAPDGTVAAHGDTRPPHIMWAPEGHSLPGSGTPLRASCHSL